MSVSISLSQDFEPPGRGPVPLPRLLDIVAAEIARSADAAGALQHAMSLEGRIPVEDSDAMAAAQGLDLITQELAGLVTFMRALAETASGDYGLDAALAAGQIGLARQKARLSCAAPTSDEPDTGELDLF